MSGSFGGARPGGRSTARSRVLAASGLALVVVAAGGGVTWAATGGGHPATAASGATGATPSGQHATGAIVPQVELQGPGGLPSTPVKLALGQALVVHLKEQAGSTGYSWGVAVAGGSLVKAGDTVKGPASSAPVGAAGDHMFTFRTQKSGTAQLVFTLKRPWEAKAAKTVTISVSVGTPAPGQPTIDVVGPDALPTTPVALKAGQKLVVHLREQAGSTGYSWSATAVPKNLALLQDVVVPGAGAPGAAGEHDFTFQVTKAGDGRLEFALRRPGSARAAQRASVRITVPAADRTVDVYGSGPEQLPRTPVVVKVGDTVAVHLTERAGSTGQSWGVSVSPTGLTRTGETVVPGQGAPGSAGEHLFTFRVDSAGKSMITFALCGPGKAGAVGTLRVRVAARG